LAPKELLDYLPFMETELLTSNMKFFYDSDKTHNIFIKLCHQDDTSNQDPAHCLTDRSCWKHLGRELLSFDVLMDALLLTDNDSTLRIPLSCLVSYKGFRAIAIAYSKVSSFTSNPKVGFFHGNYYQDISESLKDQLSDIGLLLNLNDSNVETFQRKGLVPLSKYLRIHQSLPYHHQEPKFESDRLFEWYEE